MLKFAGDKRGPMLKFRNQIPWPLELKLQTKFGYELKSRNFPNGITFMRRPPGDVIPMMAATSNVIALPDKSKAPGKLSLGQELRLEQRCDNIVSRFKDPYNQVRQVRTALHNMAQALRDPLETEFVHDYMDEQFPADMIGL